jgi:hypothetical protein
MNDLQLVEATLELAAKALPKGYGLYDFGGNNSIVPRPYMSNDNVYLKNHMAAIEKFMECPADPVMVTAFSFDLQSVTARQIVEGMEKALEINKTQTKEFVAL